MGEVVAGQLPDPTQLVCNACQLPVCTPAGHAAGFIDSPLPLQVAEEGRLSTFCSEPCEWVWEETPELR